MKSTGKVSAMMWKQPIKSNKSPNFLFTIKKGQKESVESSLGVSPSLSPVPQTGWATGPLPALTLLLETSFAFFQRTLASP